MVTHRPIIYLRQTSLFICSNLPTSIGRATLLPCGS